MIEKYMSTEALSVAEEMLYQAALQVRGGVELEQALKWYTSVKKEELVNLLQELKEYDDWRDSNGVC